MPTSHPYRASVRWTGNRGVGTLDYRAYGREHEIEIAGKSPIPGSADPRFRGDPARPNPEELLVAALSACHMLWYLHLCADSGIVVEAYLDQAEGTLETGSDGSGQVTAVTLRPKVTISRGSTSLATELHLQAHRKCFIARSVNFPVLCDPTVAVDASPGTSPGPRSP